MAYPWWKIAKAKKLWPGRGFIQQDARRLQYDDRSFDVVMSGACIAHIEQWEQALGEICRIPRQWLILHRNPIQPHDEETTLKDRPYGGVKVWIRRFKRSDLHDFVQAQGFSLIQSVTSGTNLESYLYKRTADD
ncbi:MAG: class I SAM-dependent methyltransferase [Gammaproteobacteria bacterium]|nr:class I SAM-dependent methyltransferase [Gammaproteobacteria bacterium]